MAKRKPPDTLEGASATKPAFAVSKKSLDPALASLFAFSSGPVTTPSTLHRDARNQNLTGIAGTAFTHDDPSGNSPETAGPTDPTPVVDLGRVHGSSEKGHNLLGKNGPLVVGSSHLIQAEVPVHEPTNRKRKRREQHEEIEDAYMRRLAREEAAEDAKRNAERSSKRQRVEAEAEPDNENGSDGGKGSSEDVVSDRSDGESKGSEAQFEDSIPQHESLAPSKDAAELEKASRTVFLANVSTTAITSKSAHKTLLAHLASFLPSLPAHSPPHSIESFRFRSTAFASALPKKAAFAKKSLMDATTKSTNAYVVYSTQAAAREAAKHLNATVVLDRHLRADSVAHPAPIDHRRCLFVGNLGFVDDQSNIDAAEDASKGGKPKKKSKPGDVEEGLWREFGKAGTVESVRVVRDPKTRVGKGFAYVQFTDENGVEAALPFDGKRFPPLLPRKLRVVRAKGIKRNAAKKRVGVERGGVVRAKGGYDRKVTGPQRSLHGRAEKLLGRAGAAQMRVVVANGGAKAERKQMDGPRAIRGPESFVFEGHRASSKQGKSGLNLGPRSKKSSNVKTRVSKRSSAWKAAGGRKPEK